MNDVRFRISAALGAGAFTILAAFLAAGWPAMKPQGPRKTGAMAEAYAKLPVTFVENRGQIDPQVRYFARGPHYAFFLTPNQVMLSLAKAPSGIALGLEFLDSNPEVMLAG